MKTSNLTDFKTNKSRIKTKINDDVSNSRGWFSSFKKSFGNRKTRTKSIDESTKESSKKTSTKSNVETESQDYFDSLTSPKDGQLSNFSKGFLDSFVQKSCTNFCNEDFRSKFQKYHSKKFMNPKLAMQSFHYLMFSNISEHPRVIEKVLMVVVEDYICSVCEKMLQNKMRSVYKKIENWSKNPLTRPGFKKPELILGGNITKPEKHFVIESNPKVRKDENSFFNSFYQNHFSTNHDKNHCSKDFLTSSTLDSRPSVKIKESKSSRKSFPLDTALTSHNSVVENSELENSLKDRYVNYKLKSHKKFKSDSSSKQLIEENQNPQAVRSAMKTSEFKPNLRDDNVQKDKFSNTFKDVLMSNKPLNIKTQGYSICTDVKSNKYSTPCRLSGQNSNNQMSNNVKSFKVCRIVNIDIKPFEKDNPYLFSRIPKHHTRLNMEKQHRITVTDDDVSLKLNNVNNQNLSLNRIIRPKIRRSVTFVEPWKGVINSSLCKDAGFCSEWEVRSELNKSGILTSTKSEEFNYLLSSNISIPDLYESHNDNLSSLTNQPKRTEVTNGLIHSVTSNDVTLINDIPLTHETKNYFTTSQDNQTVNSFSPVIISLQSTPSFVGDINYPYFTQNLVQCSKSPTNQIRKISSNTVNSFTCVKNITKSSENIFNNLNFESHWNMNTDNMYIPDLNEHSNSKNYSVIEIVKQSDSDPKTDHHLQSYKNENKRSNIPIFTTQPESANSSYESTMIEEDVLITTSSSKSNISNQRFNLQEIILSDDEETYQNSKPQEKQKDLSHLRKVKTANFSSSARPQEKDFHNGNTFKNTTHLLSETNNKNIPDLKLSSLLKPKQVDINDSKTSAILDLQSCKKENNNNLFKHTVASKQKMRDKASKKITQERNPMKFSKGIPRIY